MTGIERSVVGVTTFLVPRGPLNDTARVSELRDTLEACIADRELRFVVDLSGVSVINSEGLEVLLDVQTQLAPLGGELKVANANAAVVDVFRITRLSEHIASVDGQITQARALPPRQRGGRGGVVRKATGCLFPSPTSPTH